MDKPEILVVEDEDDARAIIANELQGQGARVLLAANDTEALDMFYRHGILDRCRCYGHAP